MMAMLRSQKLSGSERLYRWLLLLYPKAFRRVYGQEMARIFRDCYYAEREAGGARNLPRFWGLILSDLFTTVCKEHYKATMNVAKSLFGLEEQEFLMAQFLLNLDTA